ncbi:DedA family protein [Neisseriaceae bacterium JH1-16]|nr:DedA family protein [Neisseriaceae bacterium JH1-16]
MDILQLLLDFFTSYGYFAVFFVLLLCGFGVPIPEDITLVAGGVISGLGYANVHVMFAVGMAGVLLGDAVMFTVGHVFGPKVLRFRLIGRILTPARFQAVQEKFDKYGSWVLFVARFLPGLRSPIFITAGMSGKVSYLRFLVMDGLAALISVPVWVYLGYFGASNREWLLTMVHRGQAGVLLVVGLLLLTVGIVFWRKKKLAAAMHRK